MDYPRECDHYQAHLGDNVHNNEIIEYCHLHQRICLKSIGESCHYIEELEEYGNDYKH